ncbi:hypothetical protein SAMN02745704_01556 [Paucidesulfovibrio gracilis DSM 16080]|uniref:Uncharacterized protein n=1 Tax=Paucidesulfovibrio gracilis DSM 16080 TaxID=1121449 RepID=A0A1T4WYP7_9BACT|nr:hypothetical protein [Paucidesulfovibrio gracilis]SKA82434.1 hypothetical protein SAMN02745704_01556 [Paucidesulfovibrio gracilis DSM 16080]
MTNPEQYRPQVRAYDPERIEDRASSGTKALFWVALALCVVLVGSLILRGGLTDADAELAVSVQDTTMDGAASESVPDALHLAVRTSAHAAGTALSR